MRKGSRWLGLVVSLALVVVMTVGAITTQASIYRVGKFDIYYYNNTDYGWARSLGSYVSEAWRAAYTVIGNQTLNGQMQVRFYSTNNNILGYMYSGTQNIYLNRYKFSSYANWGGTLAHETSHVLFYNYTKAVYWTASYMNNYRTFITETLARYTGDVAYAYGDKLSAATTKYYLKYFNKLAFGSGKLNWYSMGYYYTYGSGNSLLAAIYGQMATGYYLTGGLTNSTSSRVANLMYYMKVYSSYAGSYLRSSNYSTAQAYFEGAFKYAYGYYANAGLIYGGITNTNYLMGKFYYQWYV
jgi:hypothetical protein